MQQWEYFTTFIESNTEISAVPQRDDIPFAEHPKYTPYSLIPQLNMYGAKGWELVSMQPVVPGKNNDVMIPDSSGMKWSRTYVCAFKRPLG